MAAIERVAAKHVAKATRKEKLVSAVADVAKPVELLRALGYQVTELGRSPDGQTLIAVG